MKIDDLTRAELAEWIADWCIADDEVVDQPRSAYGLMGFDIGEWLDLHYELLDAYAATTVPPQERATWSYEPSTETLICPSGHPRHVGVHDRHTRYCPECEPPERATCDRTEYDETKPPPTCRGCPACRPQERAGTGDGECGACNGAGRLAPNGELLTAANMNNVSMPCPLCAKGVSDVQ